MIDAYGKEGIGGLVSLSVIVLDLMFSWVFNFVLIPFDLRGLLRSFRVRGYEVVSGLPPVPFRGRLGGAGVIARKNEFEVYVDTDRQIIGVRRAISFDEFDPVIQDVRAILTEDFDVDVSQSLRYCEVLAALRVRGENVIDRIRRMPVGDVPELKRMVGEYGLIGFRIGSKDSLPTQSSWFDMEVHPEWTNPNKFFNINIVYRNPSEENVVAFARNLEKAALHLLKVI